MKLTFDNENDARVYVRSLRLFYQEVRVAILVSAFFSFVWLCAGAGYFWPVWFAMGWGASLVFRGLRLGILDALWVEKIFGLRIRHLTDQWEDQKVKDVLEASRHAKEKKDTAKAGAGKKSERAAVEKKKNS